MELEDSTHLCRERKREEGEVLEKARAARHDPLDVNTMCARRQKTGREGERCDIKMIVAHRKIIDATFVRQIPVAVQGDAEAGLEACISHRDFTTEQDDE